MSAQQRKTPAESASLAASGCHSPPLRMEASSAREPNQATARYPNPNRQTPVAFAILNAVAN
jgi:hypothetical protein